MRRRTFYCAVAASVVIYLTMTLLPIGPRLAVYRSVNSVKWISEAPDEYIRLHVSRFEVPPLYRVERGHLFLLIQDLRTALLITSMRGSDTHWDAQRVGEFRATQPELEQYWPKPNEPSAGVLWIEQRWR